MNSQALHSAPSAPEAESIPAPWHLKGHGYVFPYRFPIAFVRKHRILPPTLRAEFKGGFGALMLIEYTSSDCGPYHELLLVPGSFSYQGKILPSIAKIFVSSMASVVNGQRNWGMPKALADFKVTKQADGSEVWRVLYQGKEIFQARLRTGFVPVPIYSGLVPHTLMQSWEQKRFFTKMSALGYGRRAKLLSIRGDGLVFPDLSSQKPYLGLGLKMDSFTMTFHVPEIQPEDKV